MKSSKPEVCSVTLVKSNKPEVCSVTMVKSNKPEVCSVTYTSQGSQTSGQGDGDVSRQ